jgi:type VI secretion system protein ImpK
VPSFDTLTQPLRERMAPDRRQRGATARALSPHWRGIATRGHRDLALLPLWSAVALAGALLLASWFVLNTRLDARARPLFASIAAVPAALQGTAAAAPVGKPRLAAALSFDTPAGPIEVRDEAQRSLIVVPADALFADGSARLDARAAELLTRVAQALRAHITQAQGQGQGGAAGELSVIGHGDAASPSLKFPSNWHFTRARAQAVADALGAHGVAPARAEGRAEFEPRAGTDTARPRHNDRIEIELRLPRPDQPATP